MEGNNLKNHGRTSETALTHREGKDAKKNQRPSMSYEKKEFKNVAAKYPKFLTYPICSHTKNQTRKIRSAKKKINCNKNNSTQIAETGRKVEGNVKGKSFSLLRFFNITSIVLGPSSEGSRNTQTKQQQQKKTKVQKLSAILN